MILLRFIHLHSNPHDKPKADKPRYEYLAKYHQRLHAYHDGAIPFEKASGRGARDYQDGTR